MKKTLNRREFTLAAAMAALSGVAITISACSGGGSGSTTAPTPLGAGDKAGAGGAQHGPPPVEFFRRRFYDPSGSRHQNFRARLKPRYQLLPMGPPRATSASVVPWLLANVNWNRCPPARFSMPKAAGVVPGSYQPTP